MATAQETSNKLIRTLSKSVSGIKFPNNASEKATQLRLIESCESTLGMIKSFIETANV